MTAAISILVFMQAALNLTPPPAPDFKTEVDYAAWYEKVSTAGMTPEQNAAALYDAIFAASGPAAPGVDPAAGLGFNGPLTQETPVKSLEPWDPATRVTWEAAYQKTRPLVAQFRRAAALPCAWWEMRTTSGERVTMLLDMGDMPEFQQLRRLTKGVLENAWRAPKGKPDAQALLDAARDCLNCVRQVQRLPSMIAQLVAIAIRSEVYDTLRIAADTGALESAHRAKVLKLLKENDSPVPPFRYALNLELASAWSAVQHVHFKNGGRFGAGSTLNEVLAAGARKCDVVQSRDVIAKCFEALWREADKPYDAQTTARMDAAGEQARRDDILAGIVVPALSRAYELRLRAVAMRRGTRLVYEVLAFHDQNKKWPATLDDLPAESDKYARLDPFSNKPFVYRVENDQPLLYSVGRNAKDDGGVTHEGRLRDEKPDSDFILWPYQR